MDNTVFKKRGNVVTSESKTDGRQTKGKGCQREGGRSAEQWERGKGDSDGHQMNKLWRAPFCRMGSQPPLSSPSPPPSRHPPLLRSSSPLFSPWQFNFPRSPPCSCLLIVSEALSLGPPLAFGQSHRSDSERRPECQNVIWDSKQQEGQQGQTFILKHIRGALPLRGDTDEETERIEKPAGKLSHSHLMSFFSFAFLQEKCSLLCVAPRGCSGGELSAANQMQMLRKHLLWRKWNVT